MFLKTLSYLCIASLLYLGAEEVSAFAFTSRPGTKFAIKHDSIASKTPKVTTSLQVFKFGSSGGQTAIDKEATSSALDLYLKIYGNKSCNKGEEALTRTFREMCTVYGTENALEMVKNWPRALNCDYKNFSPVFDIYTEKFGKDESIAMLIRNPNLLGCRPDGPNSAETAGDDTMALSYVVAFTRPLGPYLLGTLLGLLAFPSIEALIKLI